MGKFNLSVVTNTARGNNTSALADYVAENKARGEAEALLRVPEERLSERIVNRGETIEGLGDLPITSSLENDADARALAEGYEKKRNESKIDYTNPALLNQTPTEAQAVYDYDVGTTDATLPPPSFKTPQQVANAVQQTEVEEVIPSIQDLTSLVPAGVNTYIDLDEAMQGTFKRIDNAITNPATSRLNLEEPLLVNAYNKIANSTMRTTGIARLEPDVISKAFTFATFDTLLDKQSIDEKKLEKLAERAAQGEIEGIELPDNDVASINTEQDAKVIFDTASRLLGTSLNLPPEQTAELFDNVLPKEKSMLTNVLLQNLQENGVVYSEPGNNVEQARWLPSKAFDSIKTSVPDLVAALGKAREKAPSNIPNNNGIPGTTKRAIQGSTGRTHADYQAVWNAKVSAAMNYLGTTPWQVFDDPVNLELAFMQEVVYFGTDGGNPAGDGAKFTMVSKDGQGEPLNIGSPPVDPSNPRAQNVGITEQPMLSKHPIANHFKADTGHFTSAFNKGRLQRSKSILTNPIDAQVVELLDNVLDATAVEELLVKTRVPKFWQSITPRAAGMLVNKLNNAVMAHNSAVAQYLKSPLEANSIRGEVKYSHIQQIGASGRLRVSDNTINPLANPSDRGVVISTTPFVVNPKLNGDVEKNAKAIIARTFDWSMLRTKKGGGTEAVKAENLPRREDRIKIYDEFTASPAGKEVLNAAKWLAGFDSKNNWSIKDAISADGIVQLRDTYNNIKRSGVSQGKPVSYNRRALTAFQQAVGPVGKGVGSSPALDLDKWDVIANVLGDAKEGSLKLNNLIALRRFDAGLPFNGATLVGEMDGTNNSFAILSILLGDTDLAERAGIINTNFSEEGAVGYNRVVSDGDMRKYVHEKGKAVINEIIGDSNNSSDVVEAAQAMREIIDILSTPTDPNADYDVKAVKNAWKDIIMQAGYGKDFGSFETTWVQKLTGVKDIDPEMLEKSKTMVRPILEEALNPLKSYLTLTKNTGTLISLLNQDYTYVSSVGMPLALVDSGRSPSSRGFINAIGNTSPLAINAVVGSEKTFRPDPLRVDFKPDDSATSESATKQTPGLSSRNTLDVDTHFSPLTYNYINDAIKAAQKYGGTPAAILYQLNKIPFIQRNRAPVSPIHGEDASVMIQTINDIDALNKKRSKDNPLWFYQTYDAVTVNPKSYQVVPHAYNTNLEKVVSKIDRYGQDLQELQRAKKAAIKEGDPKVALLLLKLLRNNPKLSGVDTKIKAVEARIAKANKESRALIAKVNASESINSLDLFSSATDTGGYKPERSTDYASFEKKQRSLDSDLAKIRADNKVPTDAMEYVFKHFDAYDAQVKKLKVARKLMLDKRKYLLGFARKHNVSDSELPLFLNLT